MRSWIADWVRLQPKAIGGYRGEISCAFAEHLLDFLASHSVKIVWHRNLPCHETEPTHLSAHRGVDGRHFCHRLPALAITNDSPFDASSTSLERWVLASWIFTVFIGFD